jgi:hypothetical protein
MVLTNIVTGPLVQLFRDEALAGTDPLVTKARRHFPAIVYHLVPDLTSIPQPTSY